MNKENIKEVKKEEVMNMTVSNEHQDQLNTLDGRFDIARIFTKVIAYSDRVQFHWSHPKVGKLDSQLNY